MRLMRHSLLAIILCVAALPLFGQAPPIMPNTPRVPPSPTSPGQSQDPNRTAPAQNAPAQAAPGQPAPAQPAPAQATQPAQMQPLSGSQPFLLAGASLTEMIDVIAKLLKINY